LREKTNLTQHQSAGGDCPSFRETFLGRSSRR
jgi:hypothetical protein